MWPLLYPLSIFFPYCPSLNHVAIFSEVPYRKTCVVSPHSAISFVIARLAKGLPPFRYPAGMLRSCDLGQAFRLGT